ncbi:LCP family protein [Candidatus Falkowbacteria bacterium]|nr:LCP family protein [Candidatus Falkowbacteria bacterium]NCT55036.1 LCP family protein [Candidatus Falkowbacteria bacterium]
MIDFKKKLEEEERLNSLNKNENDNDKKDKTIESFEEVFSNRKRRRFTNAIIFVVILGLIFSGQVIMSSSGASLWLEQNNFFNKIKNFAPSLDKQLEGEKNDRINVLLLGMGGEGHDGAFLTDTIILASIKPSTKEVSLISFPRDLVSPTSNWHKINSINAYAEAESPGSGGEATIKSMSELLETKIDYYIRVDFNGFAKIIDEIGGIEIIVENSFIDNMYPISGQEDNPNYYARFEKLNFKAGKQTMSGETALKYARSRKAFGIEGSDYARARRQQLMIEAVKNKLLSAGTLLNPVTLSKLANQLNKNVSTNLEIWEVLRLWDIGKDIEREQIINFVLNDAPDNYLVSSRGEDGAFILLPKSGNFSDIRTLVNDIFPEPEVITTIKTKNETVKTISGTSSVAVLNGTWVPGLAGRKSALAKEAGFEILEVANAPMRDYSETIIYDLSNGQKDSALSTLKEVLDAKENKSLPEWVKEYKLSSSSPDLIVVLGTEADTKY